MSLDAPLNPVGTDELANATPGLQHHVQHDNANDAIEALETKVGIDGSAVAESLDYLVKNPLAIDPGHKHSLAGASYSTVIKTGDYAIQLSDSVILVNGAGLVITLPTAIGIAGRPFTIKNTALALNTTVATTDGQTIDAQPAPLTIGPLTALLVVSDGANWWVI